jgi:hypothetical protein
MARRSSRRGEPRGGKSRAEARAERITWALMVGVFAAYMLLPAGTLPTYFTPVAGAIVLLGSGLFQYSRRWRVSPFTWLGGILMAVLAFYNLQIDPGRDFIGVAFLIFAGVIALGVVLDET